MNDTKLENWLKGVDSRHRAVLVVSRRAKQIQKGLRPYFDSKSTKVTTMALEEFVEGKIDWYEMTPEEMVTKREEHESSLKAGEASGARPNRDISISALEVNVVSAVTEAVFADVDDDSPEPAVADVDDDSPEPVESDDVDDNEMI